MESSLFDQVDQYCERIDASFWSEPLNAVSNAAFLIGALVVWIIAKRENRLDSGVIILTANMAIIGVGSFLFHTFAQKWSAAADVFPILAFIVIYLHYATVRLLHAPVWVGLVCAAAFTPLSGLLADQLVKIIGTVNGSVFYMPVVITIFAYAAIMQFRGSPAAGKFAIGGFILATSLTFRSLDQAVCEAFPYGVHYIWHSLNGLMLAWMIFLIIRYGPPRLAATLARG